MSSEWTAGLNEEQALAVSHTYGPLLILAGAGSGKTTVLVARAGRLLAEHVVQPDQLCVLTFTNKAARELKHRVQQRLGNRAKKIWAGTFHSFGLMLLRKYHEAAGLSAKFGILDATDAGHIVKEILKDFDYGGKTAYDAEKMLSTISRMRESRNHQALNDDEYEVAAEWLLPKYLVRLESLGMVDFDGLIVKAIELMEKHPEIKASIQTTFQQVMVDEFQDTNAMQMELITKLVEAHKNITVVGDDDQSIYGWRGACVANILNFPKNYADCKVVRLETNYRSTSSVLNLANYVIAKNVERHAKVLRPAKLDHIGELPEVFSFETEDEEAESISNEIESRIKTGMCPSDIAVIYRSNSQGALIEAELRKKKIAYAISGGTAFFDRKETRDILGYLRCALNPNELALRRILNTPPRGIGEKSIELITNYHRHTSIPFVIAVKHWKSAEVDDKVGAAIEEFYLKLNDLIPQLVNNPLPPGKVLLEYFAQIGYRAYLEKFSGNAMVATKRWRYLEIMSEIMERYIAQSGRKASAFRDFVDSMELRDLLDSKEDETKSVQLLTMHACKGLEWPHVFLAGIEEDILPHKRLGSDIAEERRLFYVGITRAKNKLTLSRAKKRRRNGKLVDAQPSRFLLEADPKLFVAVDGPRPISEEKRKSLFADLFKKLDGLPPVAAAPPTPITPPALPPVEAPTSSRLDALNDTLNTITAPTPPKEPPTF